jgi:putative transposase
MGQLGIRGARRDVKRFTTQADKAALRAPDRLKRDFTAAAPNMKWVCDFTYCATWSGVVYVAFVIDCFSRRIVGWKASRSMSEALVLDALNMAAWVRRNVELTGLVSPLRRRTSGRIQRTSVITRCCDDRPQAPAQHLRIA